MIAETKEPMDELFQIKEQLFQEAAKFWKDRGLHVSDPRMLLALIDNPDTDQTLPGILLLRAARLLDAMRLSEEECEVLATDMISVRKETNKSFEEILALVTCARLLTRQEEICVMEKIKGQLKQLIQFH
jgi:hypothetical protein